MIMDDDLLPGEDELDEDGLPLDEDEDELDTEDDLDEEDEEDAI